MKAKRLYGMITLIVGVMLIFGTLSLTGCDAGNAPGDQLTPLAAPANLAVDSDSFTLTWDAVTDADAYTVDIDNGATREIVSDTTFSLERFTADPTAHTLKVKAMAADGSTTHSDSAYSAPLPIETADYIFTYDDDDTGPLGSIVRSARNIVPFNQTAGLTITGLTAYGKTLTSIVIPRQIGTVVVTIIGNNAFKDEAIVSVVIPATVVTIGESAFKGTSIVTIVIPESVTSIGNGAFSEISTLTEVVFARDKDAEGGVTTLGEGVFDGSDAIETIIVPDGSGDAYTEKITESSPGVTVEVTETQPMPFTITVNAGNGGTVTTNPPGSAYANTTVRINVDPNPGYTLEALSVRGANGSTVQYETTATETVTGGGSNNGSTDKPTYTVVVYYTFTMPSSNVVISATFTGETEEPGQPGDYTITVNAGKGGGIWTEPEGSANAGETVRINVGLDYGYTLASLIVRKANGDTVPHQTNNETTIDPNGSTTTTGNTYYTFTMPASNVTITATFTDGSTQPVTYNIATNVTGGSSSGVAPGTLSTTPSGSAEAGTTVKIYAIPNQGYTLANLSVIGANGNTIQHQLVTDVTIDPNGGTTTTGNTYYTFTMPGSNVTITATFTQSGTPPETYNIATNVTGGSSSGVAPGTLSTTPSGSASAGTTVKIYAIPNQGYTLASVSVTGANGNTIQHEPVTDVTIDPSGGTTTTGNTYYTFTMPGSNVTITAEFSSE